MKLRLTSALPAIALATAVAAGAEPPAPADLLAASIAHHDPDGAWDGGAFRLVVEESRPDGGGRETILLIDNRSGRFQISSPRDGHEIDGSLGPDGCTWWLDGLEEFSDEIRDRYRLTCERLEWIRGGRGVSVTVNSIWRFGRPPDWIIEYPVTAIHGQISDR